MRHYEHLKTTRAQQSVYAQSSEAAVVAASIREVENPMSFTTHPKVRYFR
jgi:hypothetical protein